MPLQPFSFGGTPLSPGAAVFVSSCPRSNNNLGNGIFKALTFSDFSTSDDIKTACQKMFSALPESGICYRIRMKPASGGTTADAYVYCASPSYGFVHFRDHRGTDYCGRVQNSVWSWDTYALKSDLNAVLMYRGVITGDLNRGRNLVIAPGIYSIQSVSTITNGPSDFGGWGIFVQFPDNLFSQMILNSPNYIKFRKYSGSDPSWGAW
jgi:hypothetical protein